jgi:hypothetical protein
MRTHCPYCGASLHRDGADQNPTKCWMCTAPLPEDAVQAQLKNKASNQTVVIRPLSPRRPGAMRLDEKVGSQTQTLVLPSNAAIKLAVVVGANPGKVYELSRPLMTIGRLGGGADIEIDDVEVSRLHCSVEVRRDAILLQDLRSKNGTFIDESRVFSARLEETSEFRVGGTILRVDRTSL